MLVELVATAAVIAAPPRLVEPFRVVPDGPEGVLVADAGGGRGRIFRVDVHTGRRSVVPGSALGRVYDVQRGPGGALYIAADTAVYRLSRGRAVAIARGLRGATDLLLDGGGIVFVESEANRVRRVDLRTRRISTLVRTGLAQPVALARAPDGTLFVTDGHGGTTGRVVRLDRNGSLTTIVSGLALPSSVVALGDGRLLVVDHVSHEGNGSVLVYRGSELVETLADRSVRSPTSACAGRDGSVYVTSFGPAKVGRLVAGSLVPFGP